jgi:hypothetical protein
MGPDEKTAEETAKAVQEVAKTTGKAIDAGSGLVAWFGGIIEGTVEEAVGILEDRLKWIRWQRRLDLLRRAREELERRGLERATRPVPLKIALPLIESGSLEDDEDLRQRWARLLANAADASSAVEPHPRYASILADLGALELLILDLIYNQPQERRRGDLFTEKLPDRIVEPSGDAQPQLPPLAVQAALWNLCRLGCLLEGATGLDGPTIRWVRTTPLGDAFMAACVSAPERTSEP